MATLRTHRWMIIASFALIYFGWGSTYLAIRFAIDTIPPLLMAGFRFLIGGILLYAWFSIKLKSKPTFEQWKYAAIVGTLLMVGGTGTVTWAEQYVPSGLASLIIATVPLWIVVFEWLRPNGVRPRSMVVLGVILGLGGVAYLMAPETIAGQGRVHLVGAFALLGACFSWSIGSIASRHVPKVESPFLNAGMQLIASGIVLIFLSGITGEFPKFSFEAVSMRSLLSFVYLTLLGMVAISAYLWLLQVTEPAKVATYAYVNPIIAISLGTLLAGEEFNARILISSLIIITGVAAIITGKYQKREPAIEDQLAIVKTDNIATTSRG